MAILRSLPAMKLIRTGLAFIAMTLAFELYSAEKSFVATPLTQGEFTAGIEGPACDRDGNIYCVSFREPRNIARVSPEGHAELFVTLPEKSAGNGIRFDRDGTMFVADYTGHNVLRVDMKTR